MPPVLRLILVRHAQTEANVNRYLQGHTDGPLTPEGERQAQELALQLETCRIDRIFSSDLRRARSTAAAIAGYHSVPLAHTSRLREWNVGDLDGLPAEALTQALCKANATLATFAPEGGETLALVRERAAAFLQELLDRHRAETILICSHGDFLRMTLSAALKLSIEEAVQIRLRNAAYTIIEWDGGSWTLAVLDRTASDLESGPGDPDQ